MIVKTDAVVLHARRFGESSKIVTLYTREFGRMSVIARGVLQPKSRVGSVLQPMAHLAAVIYRKEGRDLQNLSGAESCERFPVMLASLERMSAAMAIVEMINATVHDEDRNEELFDLLVAALRHLDNPAASPTSVHPWFLVRLTLLLGYAINVDACGVCGEPLDHERDPVPFALSVGAPLCAEHAHAAATRPMRRAAFDFLRSLLEQHDEAAELAAPTPADAMDVLDLLTAFIRYHVEGLRKLKVQGVASQLLNHVEIRRT